MHPETMLAPTMPFAGVTCDVYEQYHTLDAARVHSSANVRRDDATAIWLQAVIFNMCMVDFNVGEELTRTRWRSLVPNNLQMMEWVCEDGRGVLGGLPNIVPNFASFKLAARPV